MFLSEGSFQAQEAIINSRHGTIPTTQLVVPFQLVVPSNDAEEKNNHDNNRWSLFFSRWWLWVVQKNICEGKRTLELSVFPHPVAML